MSTPGDVVGLVAARYPWEHLTADSGDWPVRPNFLDATEREREQIRAEAPRFVRELVANGCPQPIAITLAACKYVASEGAIKNWVARMEQAPAVNPLGRPPRAWDAPGAEEAFGLYLAACRALEKPNSAACWREVKARADERGWTIPSERYFRLRLRRETQRER